MEPTDGVFDDPAGLAETAAMRLAAAGDLSLDAHRVQGATLFVVAVATIGLNQRRFGQGAAPFATDRRNRLDQREQLGDVVAIGAGENHRKRDALRFGDEMVLGAWASAIGGIRSCF